MHIYRVCVYKKEKRKKLLPEKKANTDLNIYFKLYGAMFAKI